MKHNSYFDGNVQSLSLATERGPATVGVIVPGSYSFGTAAEETMVVVSGTLHAKLPGESAFKPYAAGTQFIVAANSRFEVRADSDVAYLCYYKQ